MRGAPDARLSAFLATMRAMTARPLTTYDDTWTPLPQTIVAIAPTRPYAAPPDGMVAIPATRFDFKVRGMEVEGDTRVGVDVAYPWEPTARRFHDHVIEVHAFLVDRTPVTNRQFKAFLEAAAYKPRDAANFLKDWKDGAPPDGWAERPATWVSLEDARAYCAWAGRRLPHEWEWQYAAQGMDGRAYPWGEAWRPDAVPAPDTGRALAPPEPVGTRPAGASPFGVLDLVGTVWQWTDEFQDAHTRAAVLRGGSFYQPRGSLWYFPQAYRNDEHGKLLLMAPGRDRSGAIGFRCAADAP
ncbi:MAG: sulfatase-modifying factor protein [Caulobacteraceae bacterium]|nr:sulfatase-modifying factor protein [Caulobacteraceae bacterium]